jgi:hypothetical protein
MLKRLVVAIVVSAILSSTIAASVTNKRQADGGFTASSAVAVDIVRDSLQLSALLTLYNATNGPSWLNNTGWNTVPPIDPCITGTSTWYGIICNGGSVV